MSNTSGFDYFKRVWATVLHSFGVQVVHMVHVGGAGLRPVVPAAYST